MSGFRTKIIYFLVPVLLLVGGIVLVGSVKNVDNSRLKSLSSQATTVSLDPPNDLNFAGEIVPLHDFDVQERLDKELIRYIYYHSATIMNIKRAARWEPEMTKILREQKVPEDFFYLCVAESHLSNATSPVGAKGFWQFMPATARSYGLEVSKQVDERYDPIKSTYAACKYLKDGYRMFKNWTLVAASYNMGMGGVRKQLNKQQVDNYYDLYLNKETAAYVFRILAIKIVLSSPDQYGFQIRKEQLYSPLRYKTVQVDTSVSDFVAFSKLHGTTYKMLKVLNPWLLKDELSIAAASGEEAAKVYAIKIPHDSELPDAALDMIPTDSTTATDSTLVGTEQDISTTAGDSAGKTEKPAAESKDSSGTEKSSGTEGTEKPAEKENEKQGSDAPASDGK